LDGRQLVLRGASVSAKTGQALMLRGFQPHLRPLPAMQVHHLGTR
jgi:hypothetical protein